MRFAASSKAVNLIAAAIALLAQSAPGKSQEGPKMSILLDEKEASSLRSPVKFSGLTLGWANARLIEGKAQPLYCTPPSFANWSDDFFPLLQDWVKQNKRVQEDKISSYPRHLIDALAAKYPCRKP